MIMSSDILIHELRRLDGGFITVRDIDTGKEYIIESIGHAKEYFDTPSTHLCLNVRYAGDGNIKR